MKIVNFVKVKPHKWWSKKDRKAAKVLTDFDNYLLTRICEKKGLDWVMDIPTTEDIRKVLNTIKTEMYWL